MKTKELSGVVFLNVPICEDEDCGGLLQLKEVIPPSIIGKEEDRYISECSSCARKYSEKDFTHPMIRFRNIQMVFF